MFASELLFSYRQLKNTPPQKKQTNNGPTSSTHLCGLIVRLQQPNLVLDAVKPAVVFQETRFCLLQTLANVLLLSP